MGSLATYEMLVQIMYQGNSSERLCTQRAEAAEAELEIQRQQEHAAQDEIASLRLQLSELRTKLQESECVQLELSESLMLLQERTDKSTSMTPSPAPPTPDDSETIAMNSAAYAELSTRFSALVEGVKPLIPAVYGPDIEVDLDGPSADDELINALKQAHFQLASADKADQALAAALGTLCIAEDAAHVSIDTSEVSEALEEPLIAVVQSWRSVWAQVAEERAARLAAAETLAQERQELEAVAMHAKERELELQVLSALVGQVRLPLWQMPCLIQSYGVFSVMLRTCLMLRRRARWQFVSPVSTGTHPGCLQEELQAVKRSVQDQEQRLAAARAPASSPANAHGNLTPTPLPRSSLHKQPYQKCTAQELVHLASGDKHGMRDRYSELLRACNADHVVRVSLDVVGSSVKLRLQVVPASSMLCDRISAAMHGQLHGMSDLMQGLMAIAHNELLQGTPCNVPRLTGGVSDGGLLGTGLTTPASAAAEHSLLSIAEPSGGASSVGRGLSNLLHLVNNLQPQVLVCLHRCCSALSAVATVQHEAMAGVATCRDVPL